MTQQMPVVYSPYGPVALSGLKDQIVGKITPLLSDIASFKNRNPSALASQCCCCFEIPEATLVNR